MEFRHALVTGGGGFLGSHLVKRLLDGGAHVTVLDNWSTGRIENLASVSGNSDLSIMTGDVSDRLPDVDADIVFNMACPASPPDYQADPIGTMRTCVLGTINVMEWSKARGARIVHASTSEIYGDPLHHPQREEHWGNVNPIGPRACYDEGKRAAEAVIFDYKRLYKTDARVMRIFNTYGPAMRAEDGRVVSNFIVQALSGHPLTIYGDGSQTRSFCYVDDLIAGISALGEIDKQIDMPVNIGNPSEFTIKELALTVIRQVGSSSTINYSDLPIDDPVRRQPDITLAKSLLGWNPTTPLEVGLADTIRYFRDQQAIA
ncbi:MAG: UDP-glucuronic acid decarboxylase family protein [Pseudomonadota bacterium]